MKKIIATAVLMASTQASALGIDSKDLLQECEGSIVADSIKSVSIGGGFFSRAGEFIPPSGHANIKYKVTSLGKGCSEFEEAYGLDLKAMDFQKSHIVIFSKPSFIGAQAFPTKKDPLAHLNHLLPKTPVNTFDKKDVFTKAKSLLGKAYEFELKHHISHQQKDGFLPFYPLVHSESFQLKTDDGGVFAIQIPKSDQSLNTKDHKILSEAFFDFVKSPEAEGFYTSSILKALLDETPLGQYYYLQDFVPQVLELFADEELTFDSTKPSYTQSDALFYFAKFLKNLSGTHNWNGALTDSEFLLNHPSLLYSDLKYVSSGCLQISAVDLEDFMYDLE